MSFFTPQLQAAILRAAGLALTAAVVVGGGAYLRGADWRAAAALGLAAAGSALGYRGLAEGLYDSNRALKGQVKPGDVGAKPPTS